MICKVMRIGSGTREVEIPDGSAVRNALTAAQFETRGASVSVNGIEATMDTALQDGDTVSLVAKVEGGTSV